MSPTFSAQSRPQVGNWRQGVENVPQQPVPFLPEASLRSHRHTRSSTIRAMTRSWSCSS